MRQEVPRSPLVSVLPKTLETLTAEAPEYLQWKDPHMSKSAMRQLAVAFEDNMATEMDWGRIEQLRADPSLQDALTYCVNHPVVVGNTKVHVLGITHSSDHSAEHVRLAIDQIAPGVVALESCVDRTQARVSVQLPLVERYGGDWETITDLSEFGGAGPSLTEVAKHGLLDGTIDIGQFMIASGSVSGCPELSALFACKQRQIPLESVDILESIKIVQNASIDACGYTSRRKGDLSEGVLRRVVDEEGILSEYFRIMYGAKYAASEVKPSYMYRLIESRKRSAPFADLLLRELHKTFRPKQYWSRIFLRDLYMSFRIRRIVSQTAEQMGKPVLVIVGAAHQFGVRDFLTSQLELQTHAALALSSLLENADTLTDAWRDVFRLNAFGLDLPKSIPNVESLAALVAVSILSARKASVWVGTEWQVVELPVVKDGQTACDRLIELTQCEMGAGVGVVDLVQCLFDGRLDPYSVTRLETQSHE